MISRKVPLREVYVWQLPVRIFHWVNAFVITVLVITGYIIGNPPAIMHGTAPEANYWFGWVRLTHFIAAFIFMINFVVRIYWGFVGNRFIRWHNYIPITRKQINGIIETIKVDVLLLSPKPIYDIGHNSLAAATYFGLFLIMIIQSFSGLAMFCVSTNNVMEPFFTWLLLSDGGFFPMRHLHHILMWLFILFAIAHIYLVFYHDYIERNGVASSIIGGWKFIEEELVEEYESELKTSDELCKAQKKEILEEIKQVEDELKNAIKKNE